MSAPTLTDRALALRKWLERTGGWSPYEAIYVEFLDRRPDYLPEHVSAAVGELERAGIVRWIDGGEALELVGR